MNICIMCHIVAVVDCTFWLLAIAHLALNREANMSQAMSSGQYNVWCKWTKICVVRYAMILVSMIILAILTAELIPWLNEERYESKLDLVSSQLHGPLFTTTAPTLRAYRSRTRSWGIMVERGVHLARQCAVPIFPKRGYDPEMMEADKNLWCLSLQKNPGVPKTLLRTNIFDLQPLSDNFLCCCYMY